MVASELRIGNWVFRDMSVDDIIETKLKIGDIAMYAIEEQNKDREFNTLEPIPLTEEWLLKFNIL